MSDDDVLASTDPGLRTAGTTPRRWGPIAVVAAGVVIAATIGYATGRANEDGVPSKPPLGAPVNTRPAPDALPYSYGRMVFTPSGLSEEPDAATAWAFDPGQVFSKEQATQAAKAVGLDDEPVQVNGSWLVGAADGSGPILQLLPDGIASLTYYDPNTDPYRCLTIAPGDSAGDGSTGADGSGGDAPGGPVPPPATDCGTTKPTDLAQQLDDPVSFVKELLDTLGVDASSYEFDSTGYDKPNAASVTGYQVVEGQRTGAVWTVTLVGDKVQAMSGSLAPLVSLGSYDVVSPSAAVARLNDPRFGPAPVGGPLPYAAEGSAIRTADAAIATAEPAPDLTVAPPPTVPPVVEPGEALSWPVQEVTITKARLGLATYTQASGAAVLLPTYELSAADGQQWSVMGVADDALDFRA